jgi:carboxymethylenebutenolidase
MMLISKNFISKVFLIFVLSFSMQLYSADTKNKMPPKEADVKERLNISPRHGEWVTYLSGNNDKVNAWIVYPERKEKAPVVVVIHEIFGLNDWARAVADQLAEDGFIAIAPDFLSGKAPKGSIGLTPDEARAINSTLDQDEVTDRIKSAVKYATALPAADKKYAVAGFCWGGGISFYYATQDPSLSASIVYYGVSPAKEKLKGVKAPVLGLYGGNDNRVNATIPPAEEILKTDKKTFEKEIYDGAGHAFLRQQDGMNGANMKASEAAWPRTITFLRKAFGTSTTTEKDTNFKNITLALSDTKVEECGCIPENE